MISREAFAGQVVTKSLGDVAEFFDHLRRPVMEAKRKPGPFPYYGANGQQGTIDDYIFDEPLILLAEDGGHFDEPDRGIAYRVRGKCWVNNHAHVLRPRAGLDLNYLCRVLENYDLAPFISGTTRAKLTKRNASNIPIPVPPIARQRHIAAILDKADEVRSACKDGVAKAETLKRSLFARFRHDFPKGNGRILSIGDFCKTGSGTTPSRGKSELYYGGSIPWVKSSELRERPIYGTEESVTDYALRETSLKMLPPETVLVAMYGATIGRVGILKVSATTNQAVCHLIPEPQVADPCYLYYALQSITDRLIARGAGGAQPNINQQIVREARIYLPALAEQRAICATMEAVQALSDLSQRGLKAADSLFFSLQQKMFSPDSLNGKP
jgi:restriction endonuclease S subunit